MIQEPGPQSAPPSAKTEESAELLTIASPVVGKLANQHKISLEAALAISQGLTTLERALANLKARAELEEIVIEHGLPHSIAGQVLKKQLSVDQALTRHHVLEHRREHQNRCSFDAAIEAKSPLVIGLHGQRVLEIEVLENLKYDVKLSGPDGLIEIPKHEVKYLYDPSCAKVVKKILKIDRELADKPRSPITKVAKRLKIRDDLLQRAIDLKTHLSVTLLEGECFAAEVLKYSRYEIGMQLKPGVELQVFRHALHHAALVPLEEVVAAERYAKRMQAKRGPQGKKRKKRRR